MPYMAINCLARSHKVIKASFKGLGYFSGKVNDQKRLSVGFHSQEKVNLFFHSQEHRENLKILLKRVKRQNFIFRWLQVLLTFSLVLAIMFSKETQNVN